MKLNSNTQWYVRSVAIEFHRSALARSRVGAPPKIRFFRILYLPEMEVASDCHCVSALRYSAHLPFTSHTLPFQ